MKRFESAFKWLTMSLILMMLVSACSSKTEESTSAGDANKPSDTTDNASSGKKVTLQVMYLKESGTTDKKAQWMQENIDLYKSANPNIDFEVVDNTGGDNYLTAITTRMAANNVPDLFETWTLERLRPFAEANRLYDLTDFLNSDEDLKSKFSDDALNATSFNGKTYAMPLTQDLEIVYYNKDVFQKYNLQVPQTYDELLNIIDVLKSNDIVPITLPNKEPWMGTIPYMMIAERIGGMDIYNNTVVNKTGSWTDNPFIEAAAMLQDLVKRGAFDKNVNNLTRPESEIKLSEGKAGMYIGLTSAANENLIDSLGDKLGFFNFPDVPGGKGSKDHYLMTPTIAYSVGADTKHPEEVKAFLKFIYSNERQLALAKVGSTLAYKVKTQPGDLPEINEELEKASKSATGSMYFWDMPLGAFMGKELNNTTQSLYMGVDPQQAFSSLQKSAESEQAQAK